MTGMVRIRAKAIQPPRQPDLLYPAINGILPSWPDIEVFVVAEDGTETPLTGVRLIEFQAMEGDGPLKATLEVYVDELDVLAEGVVE